MSDAKRMTWQDARTLSAAASETAMAVVSDWTPWAVAAAPALAIARGLRHHDVNGWLIFVVALAVELAGVLAGHTLTEAREANAASARKRSTVPIVAALTAYVIIGTSLAVLLDAWPGVQAATGIAFDLRAVWPAFLPLLAVMVYWLNGERQVIRQARMDAQPAGAPSATPAPQERNNDAISAQLARNPATERAPSAWSCGICGDVFASQQALAAHGRKHKPVGVVATNGHGVQ